ncbi:MAG: hypothetical protein KAQ95_13960 [Candidatus Heimdallarchaeota archaeon]|nr:hypothetical protein [Candidatus Heimdallarchaeota archaeon]
MNHKWNRIISSLILALLVATNFSGALFVMGLTNPESNLNLSPMLSDSYNEDFTTTAYEDGATTAFGWGSGYLSKNRVFSWQMLDSYESYNPIRGLDVQGRKVYAIGFNMTSVIESVLALDIVNPSDIQLMSYRNSLSGLLTCKVSGDYFYAGGIDSDSALDAFRVYNVTEPYDLDAVGRYLGYELTDGPVTDIDIEGNLAYITVFNSTSDRSLRIIDIEDPDNRRHIVSEWNSKDALGIDVEGRLAYIAASTEGFYILNVSDKFSPIVYGHISTPGNATDVLVDGDLAYIADGPGGIHVVDISNPSSPAILGSYDTPGYAHRLKLQGKTLFVADGSGGVQVLDVSNPLKPVFVTENLALPYVWDLDLYGGVLVVGTDDGISTFNICANVNGMDDFSLSAYPNPFDQYEVWDVRVQGDIAYIAGGPDGFYTLNVRNPANPILLDRWNQTGLNFTKLDIDGQFAHVIHSAGSYIFDIRDPTDIKYIDYVSGPDVRDVYVHGNIVYWGFDGSIATGNLTYPSAWTMLESGYVIGTFVTSVWGQGTKFYAAEWESGSTPCMHTLDVRDFTDPVVLYSRNRYSYNYDIHVDGDILYLAGSSSGNGMWMYNVSDPNTAHIFDNVYRNSLGVWSFGQYVMSADYNEGVSLIDATNPYSITLDSYYPDATRALQITTHGDFTYVANMSSLVILRHFLSAGNTFTPIAATSLAQSSEIGNVPEGEIVTNATLTVDELTPAGTDIEYLMSADGGINWEPVTPGVLHEFVNEGHELQWQALFTGPSERSPYLYELTINFEYGSTGLSQQMMYILIGAGGGLLLIIIIVVIVVAISKKKKVPTR